MPIPDKLNIESTHSASCSYHGSASRFASEFFSEGGSNVALALNPCEAGMLTIGVDGEKVYAEKTEDGNFPDVTHVKELRAGIRQRLAS